jgi:hypothetical protein
MTIDPQRLTDLVWRLSFVLIFGLVLSTLLAGAAGYQIGYNDGFDFALQLEWG